MVLKTDQGQMDFDQVAEYLCNIIKTLSDPERATGVLGSIPNPATVQRLEQAESLGTVLMASETHPVPGFDGSVCRTPLVLKSIR